MTGLDTNVLVRYLVGDDPQQSAVARQVMADFSQDNPGYLASVVLAELGWVLAHAYEESRERIADAIEGLLRANDLTIENRDAGFRALALYRAGRRVDFADALIAMISALAGVSETVTFDRKAALEGPMRLLTSERARLEPGGQDL